MTTAPTRPVSVEELKRAYRAVQAGAFRTGRPRTAEVPTWTPSGPVLTVVPAAAGVGATTLALALATAAGESRVVECAPAPASGLAAAPTAELGRDASGWLRGTRGPVSIERAAEVLASAGEVPLPLPAPAAGLTVVDLAWEVAAVLWGDGWLTDLLTTGRPLVVAATASVPGLRRLEVALELLGRRLAPHARTVVALAGPARRALPRPVAAALDALDRTRDLTGRVVTVPVHPPLRTRGIDSTPLPAPLLRAAGDLLDLTTTARS